MRVRGGKRRAFPPHEGIDSEVLYIGVTDAFLTQRFHRVGEDISCHRPRRIPNAAIEARPSQLENAFLLLLPTVVFLRRGARKKSHTV